MGHGRNWHVQRSDREYDISKMCIKSEKNEWNHGRLPMAANRWNVPWKEHRDYYTPPRDTYNTKDMSSMTYMWCAFLSKGSDVQGRPGNTQDFIWKSHDGLPGWEPVAIALSKDKMPGPEYDEYLRNMEYSGLGYDN